jgi:cellulose synthase/poly-beta-1,6-N-acetylglucosamine synthase-like glycosyltransferase
MPDADNRIPPQWIKCMTSYFADGVGMVCGTTLPDAERRRRQWLTSLEIVDSALLLGSCAGFSGLGRTQALIGSNFAVRRSVYHEIGTYRSLEFHDIEDLSLLHALQSTSRWKAVFPADRDTLLLTLPQHTFGELIRQRHRWMGGWRHVRPAIRTALTAGIVAHVALPLVLLLPWHYALMSYILLAVGDGIVAGRMLTAYRMGARVLLPFYPIFVTLYAIPLLFRILTRRKIEWKERTF